MYLQTTPCAYTHQQFNMYGHTIYNNDCCVCVLYIYIGMCDWIAVYVYFTVCVTVCERESPSTLIGMAFD